MNNRRVTTSTLVYRNATRWEANNYYNFFMIVNGRVGAYHSCAHHMHNV